MFRLLPAIAVVFVVALTASPAQAGLIPYPVTVIPGTNEYLWTYGIELPSNSQLRAGNFFTIYDFAGYIPGSATYDSTIGPWTISVSNTGTTPSQLNTTDNPNLPNLTFTYNGAPTSPGQQGVGNFWAYSIYGSETSGPFAAQTYVTSGSSAIDQNLTTTIIPVPAAPPPGVPEPTTLALAGLGLPVLAFYRRRRQAAVDTITRIA